MQPIIKVENLGKSYLIGHQRESYTALRDVLTNKARQTLSNAKKFVTGGQLIAGNEMEEFWALKDINFEVNQGDRVGIIGRNGAGKSTLLKVLSRITEPTTGRIRLKGRVASLLEVGTGFHPELSGRENIYLNGAILGMGRAEVRKKFDEIVDFAGVEKFLDTPVKRYSSGMYVRLAFAVAAHLEPEILIIDEVLAVGDAEFQKKCLGKMEDVSKNDGRTVLFVSHNIAAVRELCNKGILLRDGQIILHDTANNTIKNYLSDANNISAIRTWDDIKTAPGNNIVKLKAIKAININRQTQQSFRVNEEFGIEIEYEVFEEGYILWQGFNFFNSEGVNIFDAHSVTSKWYSRKHPRGKFTSNVWLPANLLGDGDLRINFAIFNHEEGIIHLYEKDVIQIKILDSLNNNELTARGRSTGQFPGIVRPLLRWED